MIYLVKKLAIANTDLFTEDDDEQNVPVEDEPQHSDQDEGDADGERDHPISTSHMVTRSGTYKNLLIDMEEVGCEQ